MRLLLSGVSTTIRAMIGHDAAGETPVDKGERAGAPDRATIDPAELREVLRQVIDPEIGLDIVDLGLLYRLEYVDGALEVDLTMTSPACPVTAVMAADVEQILRSALPPGVPCRVRVVWDPPWNAERISAAGRERLGW